MGRWMRPPRPPRGRESPRPGGGFPATPEGAFWRGAPPRPTGPVPVEPRGRTGHPRSAPLPRAALRPRRPAGCEPRNAAGARAEAQDGPATREGAAQEDYKEYRQVLLEYLEYYDLEHTVNDPHALFEGL